jgi:CubicO group peptidase (beta-lactamase class C family)
MDLPISPPATQGVASEGIVAFIDALEADPNIEPHGLIVQRHGHRIAEGYWAPHTPDRRRLVYSLSKTFTGTALALQLGEGRLALDDLVSDHLPELFEGAHERTRRMKIRHIVSMATGHDREMIGEAITANPSDPVRGFFTLAPDAEPGTLFAYNQPPVLALATILQRLCGERLSGYLRPRVLDPLGVVDLRWAEMRPGLDMGFSGVYTNLDAVARLGQLYLDDGMWNGQRLLPEGWVAQASSVQIANPQRVEPDWRQGYGFQLWRSQHGYRGDGAFGQYMVVLPGHDAVIAMFSCEENMQAVLDLMWAHLLPAFGPDPSPAGAADQMLSTRLSELTLPTVTDRLGGTSVRPMTTQFGAGPVGPTSHRSITSIAVADGRVLLREGDRELGFPLSSAWSSEPETAVSASSTMLPDGRIAIDLVLLASPHRLEITLDPTTSTFSTHWPITPLFLAGMSSQLSSVTAPD